MSVSWSTGSDVHCGSVRMRVMSEVVQVVSAYEGTGPEQLTIQPGQLIHVYKKGASGWWEGELQVGQRWTVLFVLCVLYVIAV